MRIDSCRSCGEMMQEFQSCPDCKVIYQFVCPNCKKIGEVQIHLRCNASAAAIAN